VTEQDHTMFASFALMGILQRVDPGNTQRAHYCDQAWQWADAMVATGDRRARERGSVAEGIEMAGPATGTPPADDTDTATATTTSDR
jgi:hypothetical protein